MPQIDLSTGLLKGPAVVFEPLKQASLALTELVSGGGTIASNSAPAPSQDKPSDPRDFSDKYNTPLSPKEQAAFSQWAPQQSAKLRRNILNDMNDYDLQGWFKANGPKELSGAHLKDTFKKPNHPTFSDQSKYNGVDGYKAGTWVEGSDKSMQFNAGPSNLYSPDELQSYFQEREPGVKLVLPNGGK